MTRGVGLSDASIRTGFPFVFTECGSNKGGFCTCPLGPTSLWVLGPLVFLQNVKGLKSSVVA